MNIFRKKSENSGETEVSEKKQKLAKEYFGLAWIAALAFFMQTLDATILNTALPAISKALHTVPLNMQLAIIAYALSVALFIPLSAWMADRFGSLHVFRYSVAVFVLGSIGCAMSQSLDILVLFRIIQGMGGALMMPVVRLTLIQAVPKKQLIHAWNLAAVAGLLGPILGPILGGWLVTYASWHWIFLINIPIGLLGIFAAAYYMPNFTRETKPLDFKGFFIFAGGLVGITLGLDLIAESVVAIYWAILLFIIGVLFFIAYYRHAKRHLAPLLSLHVFNIRTFRLGLTINLFVRLCASSIPFLIPLMFQICFSYRADMVGWLLAPIALSSIIAKGIVTPLLRRIGYRTTLIYSAIGIMIVVAMMGLLHESTPIIWIVVLFSLYGTCMSILFTSINTLTIGDLAQESAGVGSTLLSVTQQVGIGLGIAVASTILAGYRNILPSDLLQHAFSYTFFTTSLFGLFLIWLVTKLQSNDGKNLL
ncbi:putative transport protein [Actinobacillus delphinicola]|uniref:Putative transport protein n=1 Tax=Actinobacillus delphinicola TaxID=51161 RepID=A0A448TTA4_9PAST|nr:putative transport protein [Actinobacillus delphinicola]